MKVLRNLTIASTIVLSIFAFVPGTGAVLLVNELSDSFGVIGVDGVGGNYFQLDNDTVSETGAGNVDGLVIAPPVDVTGNSQVTIEGFGFNNPYGTIADSTGILTGTLGNGDPIDNRFYVHGSASIVPEPPTLLLLGLGGVVVRRKICFLTMYLGAPR